MGRTYAGILGPVGFLAAVGHGLVHAANTQHTLWVATIALFAMAAVGFVAGQLAGWIVEESVRASLAAELARRQKPAPGTTNRPSA